jgi:hypothetical protein
MLVSRAECFLCPKHQLLFLFLTPRMVLASQQPLVPCCLNVLTLLHATAPSPTAGFIVPGNPNDRIPLPGADLLDDDSLSQFDPSITEEGDSGTKGSNTSGIAFGPTVSRSPNSRQGPWLLGAGVVEAAGMTGACRCDALVHMHDIVVWYHAVVLIMACIHWHV